MFYRVSKSLMVATAGIALASMGSAAMADVLVTRSSGAIAREHPRGSRLDDGEVIRLRAGDRLTVLGRSGTRQYSRPGRYTIGARLRVATGGITTQGQNGIARTGVSRGLPSIAPISAANRTVSQMDIDQSGAFCMLEDAPVSLWRSNASQAAEVTVTRVADGAAMTVQFAAGDFSVGWPENFGATNGAYVISTEPSATTQITIVDVAADTSDALALGSELLSNGCEVQLEAFTANYDTAEPEDG
ncbi:hypothetical protein HFP51_03445 [Parasphingopyxis sp. CP4]|uniref:hypothetical protein n=1 Tax=Parasphingopyxis sp. CP4 TaxID=2724527 RepID=UPI0015A4C55A|nr:hypothetical protein [Parasphingopyxis sp. CP4]QLC21321.1 hypothetical protein HFP51_03445 [Parasphingopyxis sp. CP4]